MDREWLINRPIAHRGMYDNKNGIPENSMAACLRAASFGYPFEIDVRITRYGTVIVFHDKNIKRLTGIDKDSYDLTEEDLKKIKYKNSNYLIATLSELLETINGEVPILIELKYQGTISRFKKLSREVSRCLSEYNGSYALESFYPGTYRICHPMNKKAPIGFIGPLIPHNKKSYLNRIIFSYAMLYKYDFVSYRLSEIKNESISNMKTPKIYWNVTNKRQENIAITNGGNFIWSNSDHYRPPRVINENK